MTHRITLAHGDGGEATHRLIGEIFYPAFGNPALLQGGDSALLELPGAGRLALTTDSFVVHPLFFPGGDLGRLAVCGTVNDLAVAGARPLWLSAGFIIEEGFPVADLRRLVEGMAAAASEAGVQIVTGDTKVVGRGQADGCFINTAGVGLVPPGRDLGAHRIRTGQAILVSGPVGGHGVAVLSARAGLAFETPVRSDAAPLAGLADAVLRAAPGVACMRDPTRGGLATALADLAADSGLDLWVSESDVPVEPAVQGAAEMLGLDPLYLACEGRILLFCPAAEAESALAALRDHPYGAGARVIGSVGGPGGRAYLRTAIGGTRRLERLAGENLPRIC
ncbi:hydrogenase expression/formation protein HypE [Symbiobacterium terraclitae]|uniref:Hydrogenase expression/formation protein HypE n=1 Tax=Symbiobacterium terraclitae TaxID=557451 RepID=A0ABS4JV89_9FIRM|nr:hydrogenase expression/formation protein HypE [Symbiobacterium terraclitae]MBP2018891.1 hydrogenase expression/formation protein HypE [Symbiobacterium terraclitae]